MGFPQQEYWGVLPCPPLGDLSDPGIEPALAGDFFTTEPPGNSIIHFYTQYFENQYNAFYIRAYILYLSIFSNIKRKPFRIQ